MSRFDEEPDGDPHGECAAEIHRLQTELAAAIADNVAPAVPDGWQPIETAPTKGRDLFLLLGPSGFPQVAYSNTWWTSGFSVENKPTHWMPLPAAPTRAGK